MGRIIIAGQISSLFGALILSLRHFYVMPAKDYPFVLFILIIGFFPSLIAFHSRIKNATKYIIVINALVIVSSIYHLMKESALGGIFLLVPILSLLFKSQKLYIFSAVSSIIIYLLLTKNQINPNNSVVILDHLTVFLVMVFLIFLVVKDLIHHTELQTRQLNTIMSLSRSVEARDPYTKGHSYRVAILSQAISSYIPKIDNLLIYQSGLIHDIGKLTTPDSILLKSGRLTDQEYAIMKSHTTEGADICRSLGMSKDLLNGVLSHHERWDGKGYPNGLKEEEIPEIARILCIADTIDAMSSDRTYRKAMDFHIIRQEIIKQSGTQFDPEIAHIVLENWDTLVQLLENNKETNEKLAQSSGLITYKV